MKRTLGFGYCGLACCLCSEQEGCPGCRSGGGPDKAWCKSFRCGLARGHAGCWECPEFPCPGEIREKTRVRAFVEFLRRHGETALLDCLERNERAGLVYHYPGRLTGDYDVPETVEEILELIERGAGNP